MAGLGLIGLAGGLFVASWVKSKEPGEEFDWAPWLVSGIIGVVMVNPPEICNPEKLCNIAEQESRRPVPRRPQRSRYDEDDE
jgi:hypothetical protein